MVHLCCMVGCSNRQGKDSALSFYRIPKILDTQGVQTKELSAKRCSARLVHIRRKDWILGDGAHVCAAHFISSRLKVFETTVDLQTILVVYYFKFLGKPAVLYDQANPDS